MKYLKITLVIGLLLAIWSCGEDQETTNTLKADAYIRAMKIENKIKYAPIFLATTSVAPIKLSATDSNDKNEVFILESYWNNNLTYRWVPETENYTTSFANSKSYEFVAIFEKEEKKISETLNISDVPKPFEITEAKYNKEDGKLHIQWTNAQADTYMIQISEKIDEYPIFQSINQKIEDTNEKNTFETTFGTSSLKWFKTPSVGKEYLLSIHAFNVENNNKVRGEFIATKRFIWGK